MLLQHRAAWSHHGDTWGLLGGARHGAETAAQGALREAGEEGDLRGSDLEMHGVYVDDHGGWTYTTVLAAAAVDARARATGGESIDVGWWPVDGLGTAPTPALHPGFAGSWPVLRELLAPVTLVVDAANVVGSRPDGWWRDRSGAAGRLLDRCRALAAVGIEGSALPDSLAARRTLTRCWPALVVVLEGAARAAHRPAYDGEVGEIKVVGTDARHPAMRVQAAAGSGDDEVVAAVRSVGAGPVVVVSADRGLRDRVSALGAGTVGPGWLLDLLDLLDVLDPSGPAVDES